MHTAVFRVADIGNGGDYHRGLTIRSYGDLHRVGIGQVARVCSRENHCIHAAPIAAGNGKGGNMGCRVNDYL